MKMYEGHDCWHLIIGSDNGLVPIRRQAIIWTNDGYIIYAYMRHSASLIWYGYVENVYNIQRPEVARHAIKG